MENHYMSGMGDVRETGRASRFVLLAVFVVAALLSLYSTALATYSDALPISSGILRQSLYLLCALALAGLQLAGRRSLAKYLPVAFLPAACWFALSILWSPQLGPSFGKLVIVLISSAAGFVTVRALGNRRSVHASAIVLAFVLCSNLAAVIFFPRLGITLYDRPDASHQWRGLLAEKNEAGAIAAIAALIFAFGSPFASRVANYSGLALSTLMTAASQSRTAIIMLVATAAIGFVFHTRRGTFGLRGRMTARNAAFVAAAPPVLIGIVLIIVTLSGDMLLDLVQDPAAFSKRGYIWRPLIAAYLQDPVFGTGFGSYWSSGAPPAVTTTTGWLQTVGHGHNGYLDLLVQVGLPGLMLILTGTVTWPLFNALRATPIPLQRLSLPASIVIFCLGSNATESGLFNRDVVWSFFLVFGLSLLANLTTRAHASRSRHGRRSSRSSERSGLAARTHGA